MAFFGLATKIGSKSDTREIDPLEEAARMIEMAENGVHFDSASDLAESEEASTCAEDKESSDSNSEFSSSNASGFLTMLSNILNKAPQRKASYATGTDHWVPLDPEEIVIMPQEIVDGYKKVHPHVGKDINQNGNFSVVTKIMNNTLPAAKKKRPEREKTKNLEKMLQKLAESGGSEVEMKDSSSDCEQEQEQQENDDRPPVHHLVITFWGKDGEKKYFSLYRSRKVTDVIALCERSRECIQLFRFQPKGLEKSDYISKLLSCLKKNLLWKSIHVAASLGIVEYFKETSPHKIKSNLYNTCPEGYSALHLAVKYNRLEVVKLLVDLGADLNTITTNGENCMHLAAFASPQMIKFLHDTGKFTSIINAPNGDGSSPLYIAMSNANPNCARALHNCGASLSADPLDTSPRPLIDAIKRGKLDEATLDQILEQSPDSLNQTEPVTGNHALHCAAYKKDLLVLLDQKVCVLNLDMRNNSMQTPLHVYVRRGNLSLTMAICAYKVDINAKDINGNTPLHIAVMNLNIEIVRFLLCIGANPNLVNNHRESPRHLAARYKNNETARQIVRSLIICGARTCPANFVGCTVCCVHRDNFIGERSPQSPSLSRKSTTSSGLNDESKSEDAKMRDVAVDWNAPTGAYEFELDPDTHELDEAYKEPNRARSFPQGLRNEYCYISRNGNMQNSLAIERTMEKLKEFAKDRNKQNVISVLSLDGGGIKGLVMTQILLFLQQYLDQPVLDYFDWIAATSTGSLIMSTLFTGKFS
ncbi:hypothetical protein WR25_08656 [Diploscapter pachys]|uniref:phospholipase A2 n=1 Tax=Diploscapter pachys TaxID=2018661 RepID=A0A2A2LNZ9_9BILA|nr:hypothetical protein WR25_08656 [Diploscapter pachys]